MIDVDRLFGPRRLTATPQPKPSGDGGRPGGDLASGQPPADRGAPSQADQAAKAGQPGSPSAAGPTTTAPTGRPSPPGDPAADDQPGPLGVADSAAQREGDPANAEADRPAATTPAATTPAATTPAAPAPGRPGAGEATATEAHAAEAQADPSGAGQAEAQADPSGPGPAAGQATGQTDGQAATPAAGQAGGQADAQAASTADLDAQRLWLRAVEELAGELPPAVVEGLRDATARWGGTKPPGPRSYELRCRCGSAAWNLTVLLRPPHYGHAVRCVCGRCRKVLGLLWWADGPAPLADDPPQRGELAAGN